MTEETPKPPSPLDAFLRAPLVYPAPEGGARVLRDVAYRTEGDTRLLADVYQPVSLGEGERRPAVLLIHGGPIPKGLSMKDSRMFGDYGRLIAGAGLVGVAFNHRFHGLADLGTAKEDVAAMIDYLRAHAGEWSVDPERIILWASSGGGPLLTVGLEPERRYVRGLVAYYAFLDLALSGRPEVKAFPRELLERFSPLAQLRENGFHAPVLIARAGRDDPGLNETLRAFFEEALAQNVAVELINHPTGEHAFDIRNDDERSREIIRRTIEFLRTCAQGAS